MTHGAAFSGPAVAVNPPFLSKAYERYGLAKIGLGGILLLVLQAFAELGIGDGDRRRAPQSPRERQSEAAKAAGSQTDFPRADPRGFSNDAWKDHEIEVDPAAHKHHRSHDPQRPPAALRVPPKQYHERHEPVANDVGEEQYEPAAVQAPKKICRLIGNVRVPDQDVLSESDVHPEGAEREQELPQIVPVLVVQHTATRSPRLQPQHREDERRETALE